MRSSTSVRTWHCWVRRWHSLASRSLGRRVCRRRSRAGWTGFVALRENASRRNDRSPPCRSYYLSMNSVRIDKWLWAARFFKTRALASESVVGGRVRLNGERVKPSKDVRPDDTVEVRIGEMRWTVVVRAVAEKRGSAKVAATLYEES